MADSEQEPLSPLLPPQQEIAPAWSEPAQVLQNETTVNVFPPQQPTTSFPPWSGWDVIAVLGVTLGAVFLFSGVALVIAHLQTSQRHVPLADLATSPLVIIGSQIAAYPVVILFMIALVRGKTPEGFWSAIRWNWPGAAAVRFFFSGAIFAFVVEFASRWLPIPKSLPVEKLFTDSAGAYLMAAFGITLAPLLEELFFRSMLYPLLRRATSVWVAVVLTAAAFASIHSAQLGYAWAPVLSIFVVGIVFTLVREQSNSVAASFLMHSGYNATLFSMLWFATDHFRHLERVAG